MKSPCGNLHRDFFFGGIIKGDRLVFLMDLSLFSFPFVVSLSNHEPDCSHFDVKGGEHSD